MYLNYSFIDTFNLFIDYLNHFIFIIFIIISLILGFLFFINNKTKYLLLIINIIIILLIIYYYNINLLNIFNHLNHNIYFYFLNTIIYLVLISYHLFKNKKLIFHYLISLIFISYSIFMTIYLKNIHIIIIGNIYPSIIYGNYLYFIFYIYLIVKYLKKYLTK